MTQVQTANAGALAFYRRHTGLLITRGVVPGGSRTTPSHPADDRFDPLQTGNAPLETRPH
jgi:hypothetical protein